MNIKKIIKGLTPAFLTPFLSRIEASPLGYRLARGAFWSLAGSLISRGLGLFSSIIVARLLGKHGFGELGIIQSTIGMFGTFAGFGLGMTATKFIAEYRNINPVKAGRIRAMSSAVAWLTSSIASIALFVMSPWLSAQVLAAPHLSGLLKLSSIFLLLTSVNGAQIGALSGFEAFSTIAKISLWSGLVNFSLMLGGVYLAGLTGAVWAMIIAVGINWLLNHVAIRKECANSDIPYTYKGCWMEKSVLGKFALPAVLSSLFIVPSEWALNAWLVNQPDGYGQMGIFNAAKQWHTLILYLPNVLSTMTLPILSNLLGENKIQSYRKILILNSLLLTGIALTLALPVALMSKLIMSSYGMGFSEGSTVLICVSIYSVLWASNIVVGQAIWSSGATGAAMFFAALRSFVLLLCGLTLVKYGALGLAIAFLVTYVLQTAYLIPFVKYKTDKYMSNENEYSKPIVEER